MVDGGDFGKHPACRHPVPGIIEHTHHAHRIRTRKQSLPIVRSSSMSSVTRCPCPAAAPAHPGAEEAPASCRPGGLIPLPRPAPGARTTARARRTGTCPARTPAPRAQSPGRTCATSRAAANRAHGSSPPARSGDPRCVDRVRVGGERGPQSRAVPVESGHLPRAVAWTSFAWLISGSLPHSSWALSRSVSAVLAAARMDSSFPSSLNTFVSRATDSLPSPAVAPSLLTFSCSSVRSWCSSDCPPCAAIRCRNSSIT